MMQIQNRVVVSVMPIHGKDAASNLMVPYVHPSQIGFGINHKEILHIGLWGLNYAIPQDARLVLHWAGSDVLQYRDMPNWIKDPLLKQVYKHTCNDIYIQEELGRTGINADVIPFYPADITDVYNLPMPKEFAIGFYAPNDHYYDSMILPLAAAYPEYDVVVTGRSEQETTKLDNIILLAKRHYTKKEFYKNIAVLVRMTKHDSLPRGLIEAMVARRHIVTNYNISTAVKITEPVIDKVKAEIDGLLKNDVWRKPAPNSLAEHWMEKCNPQSYREKINGIFS